MKKAIAIVVCDLYPPEVGGIPSTVSRVVSYMESDGIDTLILVLKPDKVRIIYNLSEKYYDTESLFTSFDRHGSCHNALITLINSVVNEYNRVFITSFYMGRPAYMAHIMAEKLNINHYIVCLGSDINNNFDHSAHKWRFKKMIKYAKGVGIISPDMSVPLCNNFPKVKKKIFLIPPGFKHNFFRPIIARKEYDFLFIGRAKKVKGLDRFLLNMSKVGHHSKICLVVPYNESDKTFLKECQEIAKTQASHHTIKWLPAQSEEEMLRLYNISRCLVVPSRNEGAPHVVLEAMACNCAIIASDVGRIYEFIGSRDGIFKNDEEFVMLLEKRLIGDMKTDQEMARRAYNIANMDQEKILYREFYRIEGGR